MELRLGFLSIQKECEENIRFGNWNFHFVVIYIYILLIVYVRTFLLLCCGNRALESMESHWFLIRAWMNLEAYANESRSKIEEMIKFLKNSINITCFPIYDRDKLAMNEYENQRKASHKCSLFSFHLTKKYKKCISNSHEFCIEMSSKKKPNSKFQI